MYNFCVVKITQGGAVAAPVGGQVLSEVLPYLELNKDKKEEIENIEEVVVPEVRNINIKEGIEKLKEQGLEIDNTIEEDINKDSTIIKEQLPKPGIKVKKGSKITIEF
ncbi:MAG: PASTA domain-containing protein [Clostridia bacterium]|nr:PASTA domain-containing protein [Clostridia bacterium]